MKWKKPLFRRSSNGAATHAFVIGVSSYPSAKPEKGHREDLRGVDDIPSADASAMLVADWLYRNRDHLALPLGSLDVLLGGATPVEGKQYQWTDLPVAGAVPAPDSANVVAAGTAWHQRLQADPGSIAFFFICGHGASKTTEHVVFLSDLNASAVEPWSYLNVFRLATAFKQQPSVRAAVFFVDACQEFVPEFALADTNGGARFVPPFDPYQAGNENVALLSAASHLLEAYEGVWKADPEIKIGRFTETLVDAFCSCVRDRRLAVGVEWRVHSNSIVEDLKQLHRVRRPDWRTDPFEPSMGLTPNEVIPITVVPNPSVPVVILTEPKEKMASCDLAVLNQGGACDSRLAGSPDEWVARVPASLADHIIEARLQNQTHTWVFTPRCPVFDARVPVS